MYLMISSVVTSGNDPKIICTGHLHAIVTSGDNLRSVGRQMHPQLFRIAARKQRILCWKLGRGCHCGSNGSIYSFSFSFFVPSFFFFFFFFFLLLFFFFFFFFFVVVIVVNLFCCFSLFLFYFFTFLFLLFLILLIIVYYFLIGSNGRPYYINLLFYLLQSLL